MHKVNEVVNIAFWGLLGLLVAIWLLRGLRLLTFINSGVIWLLLLAVIGVGVIGLIQRTQR